MRELLHWELLPRVLLFWEAELPVPDIWTTTREKVTVLSRFEALDACRHRKRTRKVRKSRDLGNGVMLNVGIFCNTYSRDKYIGPFEIWTGDIG